MSGDGHRETSELDALDREILNRIQIAVPLVRRPFEKLAEEIGSTEEELLCRVRRLWDLGAVRRLGPILDYASWGMSGVLVAAKIDPGKTALAKTVLEDFPEITHAYLRRHPWNLWFTVIAEDEARRRAVIEQVTDRAALSEVKQLPQKKAFKLGVRFSL